MKCLPQSRKEEESKVWKPSNEESVVAVIRCSRDLVPMLKELAAACILAIVLGSLPRAST